MPPDDLVLRSLPTPYLLLGRGAAGHQKSPPLVRDWRIAVQVRGRLLRFSVHTA